MTLLLVPLFPAGFGAARPPRKKAAKRVLAPPETEGAVPAALVAILRGERSCKELRARYRDGDERVGTTTISLWGRWGKIVRREPGQPDQVYRGRVTLQMCMRLVRNAAHARLWRVKARRSKGVEDETRPMIRIGVKGVGSITVRVWGFDAQNLPAFAIARGQLLTFATQISRGQVTY